MDKTDIWAKLAAPVAPETISWRQDGKPIARDGKYFARFVAYIEANTVRERLDSVVPGEWDLTLDLLPQLAGLEDGDGATASFKARLQILGVIREDVGTGRDYKQAATDAFKRAAVRFGIGHELYGYEQNWVQLDGDGRYAKPLEDPQVAYSRRLERLDTMGVADSRGRRTEEPDATPAPALTVSTGAPIEEVPNCPKCGGRMWDNRLTKRNPKAPDFKCRDRSCDGVIWPAKPGATRDQVAAESRTGFEASPLATGTDDLPF